MSLLLDFVEPKGVTGKPRHRHRLLAFLCPVPFLGRPVALDIKLTARADPPGATFLDPVPRAPTMDVCPGGLATADSQ
jgi:hypothetical protein